MAAVWASGLTVRDYPAGHSSELLHFEDVGARQVGHLDLLLRLLRQKLGRLRRLCSHHAFVSLQIRVRLRLFFEKDFGSSFVVAANHALDRRARSVCAPKSGPTCDLKGLWLHLLLLGLQHHILVSLSKFLQVFSRGNAILHSHFVHFSKVAVLRLRFGSLMFIPVADEAARTEGVLNVFTSVRVLLGGQVKRRRPCFSNLRFHQ